MTWLTSSGQTASGDHVLQPLEEGGFWTPNDKLVSGIRRIHGDIPTTEQLVADGVEPEVASWARWDGACESAKRCNAHVVDRQAAALTLPPSRRNARLAQPTDWATLTVVDNGTWSEPFWRSDDACGGVQSFAEYCNFTTGEPPHATTTATRVERPLLGSAPNALPCPEPWYPFTLQRKVTGNVFQHTHLDLDANGFGRIQAWAPREALRILYRGTLTSGLQLGNPYVTMASITDPDGQADSDLTPVSGAVTINKALALLSSALSDCQPERAGVILVPQLIMDGNIDLGIVYQDQVGRWRTRTGHGIMGSGAFDGYGPGGVAPSAGEVWLWAVGQIDMVLGRPWSPQQMAAVDGPLVRWTGGTQVPRSYGVHNDAGVFQNALEAEYFVQGAVAFGGCCRFAVRALL